MNRKLFIEYKGVKIETYQGSNFVYVNNRPFQSMLSCKRWITRMQQHGMMSQQVPRLRLVVNQNEPYEHSFSKTSHLI